MISSSLNSLNGSIFFLSVPIFYLQYLLIQLEIKCDSKTELLKREDYYINLYKNNLMNTRNEYFNNEEYFEKYREENKNKI